MSCFKKYLKFTYCDLLNKWFRLNLSLHIHVWGQNLFYYSIQSWDQFALDCCLLESKLLTKCHLSDWSPGVSFTFRSYTICINIRCVITDIQPVSSVMVLVCSFHSSPSLLSAFLYQGNQQHGLWLLIYLGFSSVIGIIHEQNNYLSAH